MANYRYETITGFCDVCNKNKSITIDYVDLSTPNSPAFLKGRYEPCQDCTSQDCPLYKNAPQEF